MTGKLSRDLLVEKFSLGRKHDHRAGRRRPQNVFYCRKDGFRFHDHPAAATVGGVIGGVVFVGRPVADIVSVNFNELVGNGALEDADIEVRLKDFREKTENVKSHGQILDD